MYNGEVQINQEDLDRFLAIAQRLKLSGLIESVKAEKKDFDNKYVEEEYLKNIDDTNFEPPVRKTVSVEKAIHENQENKEMTMISMNEVDLDKVREKINEFLEKCADGSYTCTLCGKISNRSDRNAPQNMRYHIETHFAGLSYNCQLCNKTFRSSISFSMHKYRKHKS